MYTTKVRARFSLFDPCETRVHIGFNDQHDIEMEVLAMEELDLVITVELVKKMIFRCFGIM